MFGRSSKGWQAWKLLLLQANQMSGAPAASSAAAAGKKEEEAKEGEGKESGKAQPKGGAWWQWLLVGTLLFYPMTPASMLYPPRAGRQDVGGAAGALLS